jgi:hypothetical protein
MLYLKTDFNIHPATPKTRDAFVALAENEIIPGLLRFGGRLVAGWFNHDEWFSQINHIVAFEDMASFERFRAESAEDAAWQACQKSINALVKTQRETLYESLGPVAEENLDAAIDAAQEKPEGVYTAAILQVESGRMPDFIQLLSAGAANLPILASWRPVAGDPNEVVDIWKGDTGAAAYRPNSKGMEAFFTPLRDIAPTERMVRFLPLPYSPLR